MGTAKKPVPPSTPRAPLKDCCIAFASSYLPPTFLNGKTSAQIKIEITDQGGDITNSADPSSSCTHLVVTDAQYSKKSGRVPDGIANDNVKIVNFEWLKAALAASDKFDETPYLLHNRTPGHNDVPPSNTDSSKSQTNKKRSRATDDDDESSSAVKKPKSEGASAPQIKTNLPTIPLDDGVSDLYKVYVADDGTIYDVTLNQTNSSNNNNKFYRIQLLVDRNNAYCCWTRWGRVGEYGQSSMLAGGSLESALKDFSKKFKDKSGNSWQNRFEPQKPGKYIFIELNYEESDDEERKPDQKRIKSHGSEKVPIEEAPAESKLSEPVQRLMGLIFNKEFFANTFAALDYDVDKMPLGKLSKRTLLRGYDVLKDLTALCGQYNRDVEQKSNQYFSLIPHCFGRNHPPVLNDMRQIKREIELLESLTDMQLANDIMKNARGDKEGQAERLHLLDRQYEGLQMQEMTPLDHMSTEFSELSTYLVRSGGATHNMLYKVQDIFRIERQGEFDRFNGSKYANMKNTDRRLLWHGSRCTNFGGILSQGLRIAPPEAPVNGYMFGKGVYLADMSSKSANYCCSYDSGGVALLLLCEAEIGKPPLKLTDADYNAGDRAITAGSISTLGLGRTVPQGWKDAGCVHNDLKGVLMPDVATKPPGPSNEPRAGLQYNEYIMYDIAQIRLRYLLRVQIL